MGQASLNAICVPNTTETLQCATCAYYRMDGADNTGETGFVNGYDLTPIGGTGHVLSATGYVGPSPLARKITGVSDYTYCLERANAEKCFSIQQGGTAGGWYKATGTTGSAGTNTISKASALNLDFEWSIDAEWDPSPGSPNVNNGFRFTVRGTGVSDERRVDILGSEISTGIGIGPGYWFFLAARGKPDGSVCFSVGDTSGHILHKTTYSDVGGFSAPAAYNSTWKMIFQKAISRDTYYDEWGLYCGYLSDAEVNWIYNSGAGLRVC